MLCALSLRPDLVRQRPQATCDLPIAARLQVLDVQELQSVAYEAPIAIKGEAYSLDVDIKFPQQVLPMNMVAAV
jgi:hypothetical protein